MDEINWDADNPIIYSSQPMMEYVLNELEAYIDQEIIASHEYARVALEKFYDLKQSGINVPDEVKDELVATYISFCSRKTELIHVRQVMHESAHAFIRATKATND